MRTALCLAAIGVASPRADACGVPDLASLVGPSTNPAPSTEEVHGPDVILGVAHDESTQIAVGFAWGTIHHDAYFGDVSRQRVLGSVRFDAARDVRTMAITLGMVRGVGTADAGLDLGIAADRHDAGGTASVELGLTGLALRLTGTCWVAGPSTWDGRAELVFDIGSLLYHS
jgi:hypothetical protein